MCCVFNLFNWLNTCDRIHLRFCARRTLPLYELQRNPVTVGQNRLENFSSAISILITMHLSCPVGAFILSLLQHVWKNSHSIWVLKKVSNLAVNALTDFLNYTFCIAHKKEAIAPMFPTDFFLSKKNHVCQCKMSVTRRKCNMKKYNIKKLVRK